MEYGREYASQQIKRKNSRVRRWVKNFYLRKIHSEVEGKLVDFGTGAGSLLEDAMDGSVGVEVNPFLTDYLKDIDKEVFLVEEDQFDLDFLKNKGLKCLVLSHILEHFDNPAMEMKLIFKSAKSIGIKKIIIVVPCEKGYHSDKTHKTFIDLNFILKYKLNSVEGYFLSKKSFFPFGQGLAGKYFKYQELHLIYELPMKQ